MKTQTDKTQESQNSITPRVASESSNGGTAQLKDNRTSSLDQRKLRSGMDSTDNSKNPIQRKTSPERSVLSGVEGSRRNDTGLPNNLKSGIENLSGYSMDDVKVHYNSSKPAQLQAHAYAQGTDIHLAPGQEKHLPHEAWHVVQQKQGRVKPTRQLKSKVGINDDVGLEKEADVMGKRAQNHNCLNTHSYSTGSTKKLSLKSNSSTIQRVNNWNAEATEIIAQINGQYAKKNHLSIDNEMDTTLTLLLKLQSLLSRWAFYDRTNYNLNLLNISNAINKPIPNGKTLEDLIESLYRELIAVRYPQDRRQTLPINVILNMVESRLQLWATRLTVENAGYYRWSNHRNAEDGRGISSDYALDRRGANGARTARSYQIPPVGMATDNGIAGSAQATATEYKGSCHDTAQFVIHWVRTNFPDIRVEGGASDSEGHNFVIFNRKRNSNKNDTEDWGDNCRVLDIWWNAVSWNPSNDPKELSLPEAMFELNFIDDKLGIPSRWWYDSHPDPPVVYLPATNFGTYDGSDAEWTEDESQNGTEGA